MMTNNPLAQYFRSAELHISLPSEGKWWSEGSISIPPNNELPIYSMTGMDDLALRNADGLMNGDTTVKVIQSCCPSIKDAWSMPRIDVDKILIAIRIASYGHQMDMTTRCSKCNGEVEYSVDLRSVMDLIEVPDYSIPLTISNDLSVFLKPATYRINSLDSQEVYQQQRAFLMMKSDSITEEEKMKIVKDALDKMALLTVNRMVEYIDKIIVNDSQTVTDRAFIQEFINHADRTMFAQIKDAIALKNNEYRLPKVPIVCDECGHQDERDLTFDPSNFFG